MGSEEDSCWGKRKLPVGKRESFLLGSKEVFQWEVMQLPSGK